MIVSVWRKANLFNLRNFAFCLHFFFLLLLLVQKFIVIYDLTNGRVCLGGNLNQVKSPVLCHSLCYRSIIYAYFYIFSNQPHLRYAYHMVGLVFLLLFFFKTWIKCTSWCSWWKC